MSLPPGIPLDRLPSLKPPPGVIPNFVNPDNYQGTIIAIVAVCLTAATLFTILRIYTKLFIIKSIASEDYASCLAWAGFVAYSAIIVKTLQYGNGVHQWDVPLSSLIELLKLLNAYEIAYCPVIFVTKLAILLQIQHVFVTSRKTGRFYLVQLVIWSNALGYFIGAFILAFQCKPRSRVWNIFEPGYCFISFNTIALSAAIFNVASDVFVLVVPIFWACKLQMAPKRKLGICVIFGSGVFACLSSITRLATFYRWQKNPDVTWHLMYSISWAFGEITGGIICGCLPALPRAFADFNTKISSVVSKYRDFRARGSEGYYVKILRACGIKKSLTAEDHADDSLELRNQISAQNSQHTFSEAKKYTDRSDSESKFAYSVV